MQTLARNERDRAVDRERKRAASDNNARATITTVNDVSKGIQSMLSPSQIDVNSASLSSIYDLKEIKSKSVLVASQNVTSEMWRQRKRMNKQPGSNLEDLELRADNRPIYAVTMIIQIAKWLATEDGTTLENSIMELMSYLSKAMYLITRFSSALQGSTMQLKMEAAGSNKDKISALFNKVPIASDFEPKREQRNKSYKIGADKSKDFYDISKKVADASEFLGINYFQTKETMAYIKRCYNISGIYNAYCHVDSNIGEVIDFFEYFDKMTRVSGINFLQSFSIPKAPEMQMTLCENMIQTCAGLRDSNNIKRAFSTKGGKDALEKERSFIFGKMRIASRIVASLGRKYDVPVLAKISSAIGKMIDEKSKGNDNSQSGLDSLKKSCNVYYNMVRIVFAPLKGIAAKEPISDISYLSTEDVAIAMMGSKRISREMKERIDSIKKTSLNFDRMSRNDFLELKMRVQDLVNGNENYVFYYFEDNLDLGGNRSAQISKMRTDTRKVNSLTYNVEAFLKSILSEMPVLEYNGEDDLMEECKEFCRSMSHLIKDGHYQNMNKRFRAGGSEWESKRMRPIDTNRSTIREDSSANETMEL